MILHSIIPIEKIFEGYEENSAKAMVQLDYNGEKILAAALEDNKYMITRVISTSLKAYLDPKLQPGNIISVN